MRIQAVGLGGGDQAHDGGGAPACRFAAGKQPVLATEGHGPDRPFDRVVVDRVRAVVEHTRKGGSAFERVVDGYLPP